MTRSALSVLVLDAEPAAESLANLLRLGGHAVRVAASDLQAIRLAGQSRPDAVVCSLSPSGSAGHTLAAWLHAHPGRWPFLIGLAASPPPRVCYAARLAGFDRLLESPVDPQQLLTLLAEHAARLAESRAEARQTSGPAR